MRLLAPLCVVGSVTGAAHSIVGGSAWEATPWRATQRAVWAAVTVLR